MTFDPDAIHRLLDHGDPIPPYLVRQLLAEIERLRALLPTLGPSLGDRAECRMCGAAIEYIGPYWRHVGPRQPRHPAWPVNTAYNAAQASQEARSAPKRSEVGD